MSSKLNLGVCCYAYMRGGAVSGMLIELKADMVSFAGNTVWSIYELSETRLSLLVALQVLCLNFFNLYTILKSASIIGVDM